MIQYLGKPVANLLGAEPFRHWSFERSVEEDLDELTTDYSASEHGLDIQCGQDGRIATIHLLVAAYDGPPLHVPLSSTRAEIRARLGEPTVSGGPTTDPILGEYGAWDRYDSDEAAVHIEYYPLRDSICRVTIMRPDVAP